MHLFPSELAREEPLRSEVDVDLELPAICAFANEFLAPIPLSDENAELCDEALATLLRSTSASLKVEVAERLAHVETGPRRTMRLLAYERTPAIAVPVLRYSPVLTQDDVAAIARLRSQRFSEEHLTAIAARRELDTRVTDMLTARGTWRVLETLAQNETARFSLLGLCRLAMRSCDLGASSAPAQGTAATDSGPNEPNAGGRTKEADDAES